MISVEDLKKILNKEFGIMSSEELEIALVKKGGIRIGVFTDEVRTSSNE